MSPFDTRVTPNGNLLVVIVPVVEPDDEERAEAAVRKLRDVHIPEACG